VCTEQAGCCSPQATDDERAAPDFGGFFSGAALLQEEFSMSDELLERSLFESNAVTYVDPFTGDLAPYVDYSGNECRVCLGEHDEEIHAATLSIKSWFREEVTKSFRIVPEVVI
jgi:hypothetical protein